MKNIISFLKYENIKIKRSVAIRILFFAPILLVIINHIRVMYDFHEHAVTQTISWDYSLKYILLVYGLFYPLFIGLVMFSMYDREKRNSSFKLLFTLPASRYEIAGARILVIFQVITLSTLVAYLSYWGHLQLLDFQYPEAGFTAGENFGTIIFVTFARLYFAYLAIAYFVYYLSLLFRKNSVVIGTGSFVWLVSFLGNTSQYSYLSPYSYSLHSYNRYMAHSVNIVDKEFYSALVIIVVFVFLSILHYRNVKA